MQARYVKQVIAITVLTGFPAVSKRIPLAAGQVHLHCNTTQQFHAASYNSTQNGELSWLTIPRKTRPRIRANRNNSKRTRRILREKILLRTAMRIRTKNKSSKTKAGNVALPSDHGLRLLSTGDSFSNSCDYLLLNEEIKWQPKV
jgi:hypothetical protein